MAIGSHQSARMQHDEWITPLPIIQALGSFDLDPCAAEIMPWPTAKTMWTKRDDGLRKDWFGRVWLNPPYGNEIAEWMVKMAFWNDGIALIFARTETETWWKYIWRSASAVLFINGRLYFHYPHGGRASANSGAPSALIAYGEQNAIVLKHSGIQGTLVRYWERKGEL